MARFQIQNKGYIQSTDRGVGDALKAVEKAINAMADQSNTDPTGAQQAAPAAISRMSVTEEDGWHDVQIVDNAPAYRGINYFAYYARASDPQHFHKIDMGASQNHRVYLGTGKYIWKSNHAYPSSPPSQDVYHGGATPQPVGTGSGYSGPPMQQNQGTAAFGATAYRNSSTPPIRK
jgi:hypothetical protein